MRKVKNSFISKRTGKLVEYETTYVIDARRFLESIRDKVSDKNPSAHSRWMTEKQTWTLMYRFLLGLKGDLLLHRKHYKTIITNFSTYNIKKPQKLKNEKREK